MRIVVTGASGMLGGYLLRHLATTAHDVIPWSGTQAVPLTDSVALMRAWNEARPDLVLHAAALARVADCHRNPTRASQINTEATAQLAHLATTHHTRLVYISTDMVFDGARGNYCETDPPAPLSAYGRSKQAAEAIVLATPHAVVVRVSLLFGPGINGRISFFDHQIDALRHGHRLTLFTDEWRTPLSLAVAARALVEIGEATVTGLVHLGGPERLSRAEMGAQLAEVLAIHQPFFVLTQREVVPAPEPRPRDTSLNSSHWRTLFPNTPWPNYRTALRALLT